MPLRIVKRKDGKTGAYARYRWEVLLLLWIAFFLNQADRQIFSIVLPLIKSDLGLTDAQLGLIGASLVWTYGALVPFAGFTGDRMSRRNIISCCLLVWSTATLCTGISTTLIEFLLLRGLATGGGEAFYAPAANALLSEEHRERKSLALAVHQTAVYFGLVLSGLVAGFIAQHYGWRNAFFAFGGAGIILAVIIRLRLRKDLPPPVEKKESMLKVAGEIARKPTVLLITAAASCMVFVNIGYLIWMPSLLVEKFGLSIASAGFFSMFYHHAGALAGVVISGNIADRVSKVHLRNRLLIQAIGLFGAAPFIYLSGSSNTETSTYLALFLFGLFRGAYDSNIFASLFDVVRPAIKSSAAGLKLMCAFIIGAFAPYVLGLLKPHVGLAAGLSWLWICYVAGGALIMAAFFFFFKKDEQDARRSAEAV